MTQPTILTHLLAAAPDALAPEIQAFLVFLATARTLTPAQLALITRYEALTPERQTLVEDLIRELGKLPPPSDGPTP
jgi:hypothetical protein